MCSRLTLGSSTTDNGRKQKKTKKKEGSEKVDTVVPRKVVKFLLGSLVSMVSYSDSCRNLSPKPLTLILIELLTFRNSTLHFSFLRKTLYPERLYVKFEDGYRVPGKT